MARPRRDAGSVVARFTSFGQRPTATGRAGAVEMAVRSGGAVFLNSSSHFPPLSAASQLRAPLFLLDDSQNKGRHGRSLPGAATPGPSSRVSDDGVATEFSKPRVPSHLDKSVGDSRHVRVIKSPGGSPFRHISRPTSRPRSPLVLLEPKQQTVAQLEEDLTHAQAVCQSLAAKLEKAKLQPPLLPEGDCVCLATADQPELLVQTQEPLHSLQMKLLSAAAELENSESETSKLKQQMKAVQVNAHHLLSFFQHQGYAVAAGLDELQEDLDDLEDVILHSNSGQQGQGSASDTAVPLTPGNARKESSPESDAIPASASKGTRKMVMLRARREHVESLFLMLSRTTVAQLEELALESAGEKSIMTMGSAPAGLLQ